MKANYSTSLILRMLGIFIPLLVASFLFVFDFYRVSGNSMEPTFCNGDLILVQAKWLSLFGTEGLRDRVVVVSANNGARAIKRVLGTAGEKIRITEGSVVRNGHPISEPYVCTESADYFHNWPHYVAKGEPDYAIMPDGAVFVLGDNRAASSDSRIFGPLPTRNIVGRFMLRVASAPDRCNCGGAE